MSTVKKIFLIILAVVLVCASAFLIFQYVRSFTEKINNPILTLEVENYGNIKIELYPEYAPNTVKNIIKLVEKGYYNGKTFYGTDEVSIHLGTNSEGETENAKLSTIKDNISDDIDYEYSIDGEFVANGFEKNTIKMEKGVVALYRNDYPSYFGLQEEGYNSGNSQITILTDDARNLNGMYAAFGRVIEGMEVIDNMRNLEKKEKEENSSSSSLEQFSTMPVITNASVDTFGVDYGDPVVDEAFDYQQYLQDYFMQSYSN